MLNDYGNEVNISFVLFRRFVSWKEQRILLVKAAVQCILPKAASGLQATRQNDEYEKKNKTDCVGFMLQNTDN